MAIMTEKQFYENREIVVQAIRGYLDENKQTQLSARFFFLGIGSGVVVNLLTSAVDHLITDMIDAPNTVNVGHVVYALLLTVVTCVLIWRTFKAFWELRDHEVELYKDLDVTESHTYDEYLERAGLKRD